jgi:hypothetical protein
MTIFLGSTIWIVAQLSKSLSDWDERVLLNNYVCRICHKNITFKDQTLYFENGLCGPCLLDLTTPVTESDE